MTCTLIAIVAVVAFIWFIMWLGHGVHEGLF